MIALLLVVVAGAVVWFGVRSLRPPSILLADGSRLELSAITVGTNSTHHYGTALQRMARLVPGKWGQRFAGPMIGIPGQVSPTNVMFWFVRIPAQVSGHATAHVPIEVPSRGGGLDGSSVIFVSEESMPTGLRPVRVRFSLRDEGGAGEPGLGNPRELTMPSGERALFWGTEAVPRHSRTLVLWVYDRPDNQGLKKIGELRVSNPLYQAPP